MAALSKIAVKYQVTSTVHFVAEVACRENTLYDCNGSARDGHSFFENIRFRQKNEKY